MNPQYEHYQQFKAALEICGAKLEHGDQFPVAHLADGGTIKLLLRPNAEYLYMEMREHEFRSAGKTKWAIIDEES